MAMVATFRRGAIANHLLWRRSKKEVMSFQLSVVEAAWARSGGRCECRRRTHRGHPIHRCINFLSKENWRAQGTGAWEAAHRTPVETGGPEALSNCEVLCMPCYRMSGDYEVLT